MRGEQDGETARVTPSPDDESFSEMPPRAGVESARWHAANDEQLATHLSERVRLLLERGEFANAEPLLLRLVELRSRAGEERSELATVLASLATVRHAIGRHESAEELWRRALTIRERSLAPNHFAITRNVEHLADACAAQGKLEDAIAHLQRAIAMQERSSGSASQGLDALRAKLADMRLLTSQESTDPAGMRSEPPAAHQDAVDDRSSPDRETPATSPQAPSLAHLLVMTPDGLYSDAEPDPRDVADDGGEGKRLRGGIAPAARSWRFPATALRARARKKWRPLAVVAALAAVPLGIFASMYAGRVTSREERDTASGSAMLTAHGAVAELRPDPGASQGRAPAADKSTASTSTDSIHLAQRPVQQQVDADAPRSDSREAESVAPSAVKSIRLPDLKGIRIPKTAVAAESSLSGSLESMLHSMGSSALVTDNDSPRTPRGSSARAAGTPRGGFAPPVLAVGSPMPEYPAVLRQDGVTGTVLAEFVVDSNGNTDMRTLQVLHSDNRFFTQAVRRALPYMRFVPAESSGHRVAQRLQMPFSFTPGAR